MNLIAGGMLTGKEIMKQVEEGNIKITPYDPKRVNPNSYNLRLHPELLVYERNFPKDTGKNVGVSHQYKALNKTVPSPADIYYNPSLKSFYDDGYLDMRQDNPTKKIIIPEEGYILYPGILYIGRTVERTASDMFIPMINGRSSGGRLGISIHVCAGFGDIGFDGTWTLEITVVEPVKVYPNAELAQVCYFTPAGDNDILYRGKYYQQEDATASRFYVDMAKEKEEVK